MLRESRTLAGGADGLVSNSDSSASIIPCISARATTCVCGSCFNHPQQTPRVVIDRDVGWQDLAGCGPSLPRGSSGRPSHPVDVSTLGNLNLTRGTTLQVSLMIATAQVRSLASLSVHREIGSTLRARPRLPMMVKARLLDPKLRGALELQHKINILAIS